MWFDGRPKRTDRQSVKPRLSYWNVFSNLTVPGAMIDMALKTVRRYWLRRWLTWPKTSLSEDDQENRPWLWIRKHIDVRNDRANAWTLDRSLYRETLNIRNRWSHVSPDTRSEDLARKIVAGAEAHQRSLHRHGACRHRYGVVNWRLAMRLKWWSSRNHCPIIGEPARLTMYLPATVKVKYRYHLYSQSKKFIQKGRSTESWESYSDEEDAHTYQENLVSGATGEGDVNLRLVMKVGREIVS